ncbi:MAG: MFS transporter [Candidatus Thorarchaeota archaeon]|nr:MAG: MFS transporter [Candidatus Thorarchaeota archaeon]
MTVLGLLTRFMGLENADDEAWGLAKTLTLIQCTTSFGMGIALTFFVIFIQELLGNGSFVEGLTAYSFLIVIQMTVQLLLDYPTGGLGDIIGQRYIVSFALLSWGATSFTTSLLQSESAFIPLIVIHILAGVGNSFISGAAEAWFDNNYRLVATTDPNREQYGVFRGKLFVLRNMIMTLALVPGGLLSSLFGRRFVIQIQAYIFVLVAAAALFLMKDLPGAHITESGESKRQEYVSVLSSGIRFLLRNRFVGFLILGTTLIMSVGTVWGEMLIYPVYFSYLVSDVNVAAFQTALFIPETIGRERSAAISKRFEPKGWLPRSRLLQRTGFAFSLAFFGLMYLSPPSLESPLLELKLPFTEVVLMALPEAHIIPIVVMILVFVLSSVFSTLAQVLTQRILIDAIPSEIRNSVYSLSPTLSTLFAMPMIVSVGWLVPNVGFPIAMALCAAVSLVGVLLIRRGFTYRTVGVTEVQIEHH